MKSIQTIVFLFLLSFSSVCQDTLPRPVKSTAWQWNFGLGYRQSDVSALSERLFPASLTKFENSYFSALVGLNMILEDRFMLGLETNALFVPTILSRANFDYYLSGGHSSLNAGILLLNGRKVNLALCYGLGIDFNALLIQETNFRASGFNDAITRPLTSTITSSNSTHTFSVRFRFFGKWKDKGLRYTQNGFGLDLGYTIAGNNQWTDFNQHKIDGPVIENSGIFARIVYSIHRQKFR